MSYSQMALEKLIPALDPVGLANNPDIYHMGKLQGQFKQIIELGYELSEVELNEHNETYAYLLKAYRELESIYTDRLDIQITYLKDGDTLRFTADGIRFDLEKTQNLYWCVNIEIEDAVEFESITFFYSDWLEDVLDKVTTALDVSEHSIRFELFAQSIAKDLNLMV